MLNNYVLLLIVVQHSVNIYHTENTKYIYIGTDSTAHIRVCVCVLMYKFNE